MHEFLDKDTHKPVRQAPETKPLNDPPNPIQVQQHNSGRDAKLDSEASYNQVQSSQANKIPVSFNAAFENDVKEIRRLLKSYIGRLEGKDTSAKHAKEWRVVARVLDRIFFFIYIGTIIISIFTIFPRELPPSAPIEPTPQTETAL